MIKGLLDHSQNHLFGSLQMGERCSSTALAKDSSIISQAIGRMMTVLDHGGPSSRQHAWRAMKDICDKMRSTVTALNTQNAERVANQGFKDHLIPFTQLMLA